MAASNDVDAKSPSETTNTSDVSCWQKIFRNPKSYFIVIVLVFIYSIVLIIMEWDSNCYGISYTFTWKYYLIASIGLFVLYYIYLIILSTKCCLKRLLKPVIGLITHTCCANALLLLLWCAFGFIDWTMLYQNQCNNTHVLTGYFAILCTYSVTCLALSILQCLTGIQQYNKRVQQKRYVQSKNNANNNTTDAQKEASPKATEIESYDIPPEKFKEFVEEYNYFDGLDFSRSTITIVSPTDPTVNTTDGLVSPIQPVPNMPTLDELRSQTANHFEADPLPLEVPVPQAQKHVKEDTDSLFKSKSFSERFLGDAREMSSTMFLNYNKDDDDDNYMCTICFEAFEPHDSIGKLMCNHIFHKQCIYSWLKKNATCPLCREDVEKFANVPFL
eukprot:384152_1